MTEKALKPYVLACENIRFSSLFVAEDVSRGGTSATQRQKFHTDDAISISLRGGSKTGPGRRRKSSLDYRQQGANQVCEIRIARQDAHYKSKQNLSETAVQIHQIRTPLQF